MKQSMFIQIFHFFTFPGAFVDQKGPSIAFHVLQNSDGFR